MRMTETDDSTASLFHFSSKVNSKVKTKFVEALDLHLFLLPLVLSAHLHLLLFHKSQLLDVEFFLGLASTKLKCQL